MSENGSKCLPGSLYVYPSLNIDARHPALEELSGHISQRHPFDTFVAVDVIDDSGTTCQFRML